MLLKLFLGPSARDANPLVALIGRACCRLDNQRYSSLRLKFDGSSLLKAPHAGAAHILTLAQSTGVHDCLLKHFVGARFILLIGKGVFLMGLQERRKCSWMVCTFLFLRFMRVSLEGYLAIFSKFGKFGGHLEDLGILA